MIVIYGVLFYFMDQTKLSNTLYLMFITTYKGGMKMLNKCDSAAQDCLRSPKIRL